jgi:GNAT superfamily N-acetyltransferase
MIRNATHDDIPRLVELGGLMHAESPRFRGFPYLPERCAASLGNIVNHPQGFAAVAEFQDEIVGGMVAIAVPHYACDLLQASDFALFIAPDARGGAIAARLVRAYRKWAEAIGAEPSIGVSTGVHPERTEQLLAALGAEQTATLWTWRTPCA